MKALTRICPKAAITLLFIIICVYHVNTLHTEDALEVLFRERTESDWQDVWHRETHSRCRDKLVRQLYWACEKDIYRMTRRNSHPHEAITKRTQNPAYSSIWLHVNLARSLLRTRRSNIPSITNECCTKEGCTWEEYAEYCPTNKRRNHY